MKKTNELEKSDLDSLLDTVFSATGKKITHEEAKKVWEELPEDIKDEAIHWGIDDSVVRDNIYVHLKGE